ncbi:hypothetical protein GIB67_031884, partial [Kingdonia uniflora]
MLVPGDLGFQSLVLMFFVFFTPIVTFIIHYKWRIATARTQEIVRLVAMVAEEEARIEHEAVVDYYVPVSVAVGARHSQCAVCYCPTTTRCSRCKAIRYCLILTLALACIVIALVNVKLFIGDKATRKCNPPRVDPDENEESQEVYRNDLEMGGRWYAQPVDMDTTSVNYSPLDCTNETNDDKIGPSAACKEADLTSKSLVEELASFIPTIITLDRLEEPLANEIASSEFTSLDISVNGSDSRFSGDGGRQSDSESHFRFSFNLSSHVSRNSSSQCSEPKNITSDGTNPAITGNVKPVNKTSFSEKIDYTPTVKSLPTLNSSLKSSSAKNPKLDVTDRMISCYIKHVGGVSLLDKSVGDASKVNKSLLLNPEKPASAGNIRSPELRLSKSERIRSLSSSTFDDHQSCKNSEFSVPSMSSSNVNSEIEGTSPNSSNGLKTSMRKVVQQFKVSKLGKQNLVALGRYNISIQVIHQTLSLGQGWSSAKWPYKLWYAIDTMQSVCLREAGVNAKDPWAEEITLVGLIFGGYIRSKIKCMKCKVWHERMMDLTVEIQGDIGILEEALGRFTATKILDGDNKYECSRLSGKFGKLNKPVQFQSSRVHLDVMNAVFYGHYVCYVRNIEEKWFKIDDNK